MKELRLNYSLKFVLFLILTFISLTAFTQKNWETKEKQYFNGVALTALVDVEKKEVAYIKPFGKNVNLTYDPFYNKYIINLNEDGSDTRMILTVSRKASNGNDIFIDEYAPKNIQVEFFVTNSINTDGKLIVMTANPTEIKGIEYKLIYIFEDFD